MQMAWRHYPQDLSNLRTSRTPGTSSDPGGSCFKISWNAVAEGLSRQLRVLNDDWRASPPLLAVLWSCSCFLDDLERRRSNMLISLRANRYRRTWLGGGRDGTCGFGTNTSLGGKPAGVDIDRKCHENQESAHPVVGRNQAGLPP